MKFTRHHQYWPRKRYTTPLQRLFRNLGCNIELLEEEAHKDIHRQYRETPGGMPTRDFMESQVASCFARGCSKSSCKIAVGKFDQDERSAE